MALYTVDQIIVSGWDQKGNISFIHGHPTWVSWFLLCLLSHSSWLCLPCVVSMWFPKGGIGWREAAALVVFNRAEGVPSHSWPHSSGQNLVQWPRLNSRENGTMPGDRKWCATWHSLCLFFFFFCTIGQYLQHIEVPRLGVESELQLLAYVTATASATEVPS